MRVKGWIIQPWGSRQVGQFLWIDDFEYFLYDGCFVYDFHMALTRIRKANI